MYIRTRTAPSHWHFQPEVIGKVRSTCNCQPGTLGEGASQHPPAVAKLSSTATKTKADFDRRWETQPHHRIPSSPTSSISSPRHDIPISSSLCYLCCIFRRRASMPLAHSETTWFQSFACPLMPKGHQGLFLRHLF
ncbi:hypothetical protein CI102_13548 [Trichoderma harzianum]|nr:hypothetical protein CI102_13548 [Trichoderma harzianum]